jgi:esterase
MERFSFRRNGLTLSYLDAGGEAPVIIALHAHWMEGLTFSSFAEAMRPEWRVIALDQRGHGYSGHADRYTREDYLGDMEALFHHLGLEHAVLLGNSLGGVNAYEFAARHPERALALVIEDIGVELSGDLPPMTGWAGTFAKKEELENQVGGRMLPYLQQSFRQTSGGWRLAFEPHHMILSQASLAGDHWSDWLASSCPALLIRGSDSRVTTAAHLEQMATRRANTQLCTLDGGHIVHHDNPTAFAKAVRVFLQSSI